MSKLSLGQFCAVLLITDAFTLLCLMGNITGGTVAGFIAGSAVQFLLTLPCAFFHEKGLEMSGWVKWFYLIYILFFGGMLFSMVWRVSEALSVPVENFKIIPEKFLIAGAIAIVCLYCSSYGIKELSRGGIITAAFGVIALIIMILGAVSEWKWENIYFAVKEKGFFSEFLRSFVISGSIGSLVTLLGNVREGHIKYTAWYYGGKAVLYFVILTVTMAVSGGIMGIIDFPVITAAQLSQLTSSQRMDSLFLIVFAVMAVFSIALQAVCSASLLKDIFPKFKRFRSSLSLFIMIGAAFAISGAGKYSAVFAAVTAIAPLAVLLKRRKSRK